MNTTIKTILTKILKLQTNIQVIEAKINELSIEVKKYTDQIIDLQNQEHILRDHAKTLKIQQDIQKVEIDKNKQNIRIAQIKRLRIENRQIAKDCQKYSIHPIKTLENYNIKLF